jgi:hypothetical protein
VNPLHIICIHTENYGRGGEGGGEAWWSSNFFTNSGLPDPLGPMIAENFLKGPILWRPRYDLKFSTSMYFKYPGMVHIIL